jgi:4,4'-diaponeurosporenoate glycosyltransferase
MVCSAEDYRRIGGHAAIRADVVDDFAIARRFAEADLPVANFGGGKEISFRMYPQGLRGLLDGWTKSMGRGMAGTQWWRLAGVMFWLTCAIGGLTWAYGLPRVESFVCLGLFTVQMAVQFRQVGTFGILDAVIYPLHVAVIALLFLTSLWRTYVRRKVRWRGRDVPVGTRATAAR